MLSDLTQGDFAFYKSFEDKMRQCHDKEFMEVINPDIIRAFYRGKTVKDDRFSRMGQLEKEKHTLLFTTLFATANTVLPNLYWQNPSPIINPIRDATPESAALMTALNKYYMKVNNAKAENQEAVLNSFFFGLGWKKLGYRVTMGVAPQLQEEPESMPAQGNQKPFNFMNMFGMGGQNQEKPDILQSKERMEFIEDEGIFNASESPLNIAVDHTADLLNSKAIRHRLPRTLYELMNFPAYEQEVLDEIYQKFRHVRGSRLDTREIDLTLLELHVKQRNGIWILTWVDGFDKPLMYEKSSWQGQGFQFEPLSLTYEPGTRYPISYMKIGSQSQDKIDKMASLAYELASRAMNLTFINRNALAKGQAEAIEQNRVRGIILTDRDVTAGTFANAQSPPISNDLFTLIQMAQESLVTGMGSDQQTVQGRSKNKNLGQDEIARLGTELREGGSKDRVRDWMIKQIEKECKLLQQYSEAELKLIISQDDFSDPIMSAKFNPEGLPVEFMTMNNPLGAKNYIKGEYRYDCNIEEAIKPDSQSIRDGIQAILAAYGTTSMRQDLQSDFKVLKTGSLWEKWLSTFEVLGNPKKYIEQVDSQQLAAIQTRDFIMNGAGKNVMTPQQPKPEGEKGASGKTPKEPQPAEVGA